MNVLAQEEGQYWINKLQWNIRRWMKEKPEKTELICINVFIKG